MNNEEWYEWYAVIQDEPIDAESITSTEAGVLLLAAREDFDPRDEPLAVRNLVDEGLLENDPQRPAGVRLTRAGQRLLVELIGCHTFVED